MTIARSLVVDSDAPGFYNCTSRCVRRAFLCGGEFEHRRAWILDRLIQLDGLFAIDVCAYAVLSNHLHTMLYADHDRARSWSPREVVRRWLTLCPGSVPELLGLDEAIDHFTKDAELVARWRFRLSSVSWFMKLLKEPIARRANREDRCTGAFWEGRFDCQRIVDEAGRLSCSVYIDLNVIRAAMATTPEASDYTSVQDRIVARQEFERLKAARRRGLSIEAAMAEVRGEAGPGSAGRGSGERRRRSRGRRRAGSSKPPARRRLQRRDDRAISSMTHSEDGVWLKPVEHRRDSERGGFLDITLDQYLSIVDTLGRMLRAGKRGAIPAHLRPILERLQIDVETWTTTLLRATKRIMGTAIGRAESLAGEALRRGQERVVSSLPL